MGFNRRFSQKMYLTILFLILLSTQFTVYFILIGSKTSRTLQKIAPLFEDFKVVETHNNLELHIIIFNLSEDKII